VAGKKTTLLMLAGIGRIPLLMESQQVFRKSLVTLKRYLIFRSILDTLDSDYSNSIDHVIFKEGSPRVVNGFAVLTNHISQWGNTSNVKYVCKI
jgi:hypothetical protein